jgi:O-acetyl-ADP-ribose deacetylase (regulator of RNase III)
MHGESWSLGRARVEVVRGDLTEQRVDAIVNAANTELWLGAGVAGAIRAHGGPEIQAECDGHGRIPLGEAAVTGAGRLPARFVIHAAGMHVGGRVSADSLARATRNALLRARERGLTSVALPAIGTGVGAFPLEECARLMMAEVRAHLERHPDGPLRLVRFVLVADPARAAFARAAASAFGEGGTA